MFHRHKSLGAALVAVATAGSLALTHSPAEADFSPQPKDVVSTGSDIIQNSFNFLADGYHQLPGYNTAGNRYRFVNFDSSGDAQGRSAFTDPRLLPTITGNGTVGENGVKYIKQSDVKLLNPTIALGAGQDLVVRPSGGGAGGTLALIADDEKNIDVGRSPNPLTTTNQNNAQNNLGTKLLRIQVATDRQLIAAASTTNAPATISAGDILKIYNGQITTWGQVTGYSGPAAGETIIPLILPTDAGMWNTFVTNVDNQNPTTVTSDQLRANPNSIQVQQNDPTAITSLTPAQRANAIVPFPRGRFRTLNTGYYTDPSVTNAYNLEPERTPILADGIQLLDPNSTADVASATAPYGGNFAYNALVRESDLNSNVAWQPGSTLNWVQALFYNPGGPDPFVRTPAGEALLTAAGVTPDYHVFGTDNNEIPVD
jgi:ABC-type phosphate transport system substrate-binding protein